MSPPLDSPLTGKSARTRTDTRTTTGAFRGTEGSNPLPSSGESSANLTLGAKLTMAGGDFTGIAPDNGLGAIPCVDSDGVAIVDVSVDRHGPGNPGVSGYRCACTRFAISAMA